MPIFYSSGRCKNCSTKYGCTKIDYIYKIVKKADDKKVYTKKEKKLEKSLHKKIGTWKKIPLPGFEPTPSPLLKVLLTTLPQRPCRNLNRIGTTTVLN